METIPKWMETNRRLFKWNCFFLPTLKQRVEQSHLGVPVYTLPGWTLLQWSTGQWSRRWCPEDMGALLGSFQKALRGFGVNQKSQESCGLVQ